VYLIADILLLPEAHTPVREAHMKQWMKVQHIIGLLGRIYIYTYCRWHGAFSVLIQGGLSLACLFIRFRPIQSHLCHKPYVKRAVSYAKRALRHMKKPDHYEICMAKETYVEERPTKETYTHEKETYTHQKETLVPLAY